MNGRKTNFLGSLLQSAATDIVTALAFLSLSKVIPGFAFRNDSPKCINQLYANAAIYRTTNPNISKESRFSP